MYRVELFEHGKWRKCTYDKNIFEFLIENNLKTKDEIRNFPYEPYFLYRIKWLAESFFKYLDNNENRINWIKSNTKFWFGIIIPIIATCISLIAVKDAREERQQVLRKTERIEKIEKELNSTKEVLNEKIKVLTSKVDTLTLNMNDEKK